MSGMTILFALGICGFLVWFFRAILTDVWAYEDDEAEYIDLRMEQTGADEMIVCATSEENLPQRSHVA